MSRVSFRSKRLTITADLPNAVTSRARRLGQVLRHRSVDGPSGESGSAPLLLARRPPELRVEHRDAANALPGIKELLGPRQGSNNGTNLEDLADAVANTYWYHTIELTGSVVTPGYFDHRPLVKHYGLPDRLEGQRTLDVATFDGFWAFEMERRGADVTAIDVSRMSECDLPPPVRDAVVEGGLDLETGGGFRVAHQALASRVRRVERSVYDLDPAELGTYDLVHIGDVLVHLERPLEALRSVRRMTHGWALVADCFDPNLEPGLVQYKGGWRGFTWWVPSIDTLAQMVLDAGFADVRLHKVYSLPYRGAPVGPWRACLIATV